MSRDDDLDDEWNRALRIFRGEELEIDESKLESDYDEAVRIHRAAQAPLGMPEEAPSLDDLAARQQEEQAQDAAIAPYVRIAPPSLAGAKTSGQQLVQSGGALVQVVDWHGDDVDATAVTITIVNVGPPANLPANQQGKAWPSSIFGWDFRPFARITWGTEGVANVAEVDIPGGAIPALGQNVVIGAFTAFGGQSGSGVQLTVGASNVIVQVGMDPGSIPSNGPSFMQLGATVSDLPSTKTAPLFRTRYIDGLANGNSATVSIPPFATQVYPIRRSDISQSLLVNVQNCSGSTIDQFIVPANAQMPGPIPLVPDAFSLSVQNTGAGNTNVRIPFQLSF